MSNESLCEKGFLALSVINPSSGNTEEIIFQSKTKAIASLINVGGALRFFQGDEANFLLRRLINDAEITKFVVTLENLSDVLGR